MQQQRKMGKGMIIIAWVLALGILTYFFSHREQVQQNPNQQVATKVNNGHVEVVLERNQNNHYMFNGKINQKPVTFFVDTGATDVTIPQSVATKLGLKRGYQGYAHTANGTITVYSTRLDSLSIGAIQLYDIRATITPSMQGEQVLLGMSALKHLEFTQKKGVLILRQTD